tara:strand:+ start:1637 stop:2656 length:1020 start_codon:yes stop_codon:yes gene_type:complete
MLFATGKFNQIRYLPFSRKLLSLVLKNRIKNINDVNSYQNLFEGIVSGIVQQSINKFSIEGIKNLDSEKGYLYISNHRDITLDSALLNLTLHQNNLKTTYNAVGNNLLSEKWASDLMRLNKSFIIDRSDKSKRDIYKSLNLASEFIFNAIKNKNESVWIAQKQGRSKDGNDYTDPSVIKMIHLNSRKKVPVDQYLNSLNVVPVSISYEKDPNDLLKAKELYLTDLNQKYTKDRKEDMESISDGITGDKGDVHLSIGKIINFESDSYDDCSNQITKAIKDSYKLHPTNYAAAIIQGKDNPNNSNDLDKIDDAIQYLENRIKLLPEDMQSYLLNQYSNPVL